MSCCTTTRPRASSWPRCHSTPRRTTAIIAANSVYNPFAIPFGGVDGAFNGLRTRMVALGNRRSDSSTNDSLVNAGLKGKILDTGWEWDTNFSTGRKDQDTKHLRLPAA